MRTLGWQKYIFTLLITSGIFFTAIFISNYFNEKRVEEIQSIENKIAVDILSIETQFDLLQELSCENIAESSILFNELDSLGKRLEYTEGELGADNAEVLKLKRSYSLLEIKDYLLMKKIAEKCNLNPIFIFYFYSNKGDCDDCAREGHVLTRLKQQSPELRVYSFDYNLDLSALKTLIIINKISNELPALVIEDEVYYGFQSVDDIEKILPALKEQEESESENE